MSSTMLRRLFPQSLRAQFALALSTLALLVLAAGVTAVYALRTSNNAITQLAEERLVRIQDAQDMLEHASLIERETYELLTTASDDKLHASYANIVQQLDGLDLLVMRLAHANTDAAVLDLHQASQLFRNTANIVAQLRESTLQTEVEFSRTLQDRTAQLQATDTKNGLALAILLYGLQTANDSDKVRQQRARFMREAIAADELPKAVRDDAAVLRSRQPNTIEPDAHDLFSMRLKLINEYEILRRFHDELQKQAGALVASARTQSTNLSRDYRDAVQRLVDASRRDQQWVLVMLACSLLFAWLVSRVFMGRHVLARLHEISLYLRQDHIDDTKLMVPVHGNDEIGDMARAVERFLHDRQQLEKRTIELNVVKERVAAQYKQLQQEAYLRTLLATIPDLVWLKDPEGVYLICNPEFEKSIGAPESEIVGKTDYDFVDKERADFYRQKDREAMMVGHSTVNEEWVTYASDGRKVLLEKTKTPMRNAQGNVIGILGIGHDITQRKSYEAELEYQATHDSLTGLANRTLLTDRMEQSIAYAHRAGRRIAVMVLDLDRFKLINDSLGHAPGDAVLQKIARQLAACVRPGDTVARLGGDEFMIIMTDMASEDDAATLARNLLDVVAQRIAAVGHDIVITASLGVSIYPRDGESAATLFRNADAAMYRAKELGRNRFQFYAPEMNERLLERLEMESGLRRALEQRELVLYYQPKVDLLHGRVVGAEALIRWNLPGVGLVSPGDFIPLAEETGLIVPIGEWVIETACAQLKSWQNQGLPGITMAINISARQFQQANLSDVVAQALRRHKIQGHDLDLEVTESAIMADPRKTAAILREWKGVGVRISLDDFGTGYSSLSYLKRFPIDNLKIDQSFVHDVTTDPDDAAIARMVITLAHSLKQKVIAEGVETGAQLEFLRREHCNEMQGYFFSCPLSGEEFAALLRSGRGLALADCLQED